MINRFFLWLVFCSFCFCTFGSNLSSYMKSQALVWEQLPYQWNEGAFVGNGIVGMMIYVDSLDNSLTFWLGRGDVTDHRLAPDNKTSMGKMGASVMTDYCRMDIGKLKILPHSKILSGTMVLDIFNGEIHGNIITLADTLRFAAFTPRGSDINVMELEYHNQYELKYIPGLPYSPRLQVFPDLRKKISYKNNPSPDYESNETAGSCVYRLNAGGDYSVCWQKKKDGYRDLIYVSMTNSVPLSGKSKVDAESHIKRFSAIGFSQLKKETNAWWNEYWKKSMIDIPDKKVENFYNIQMYKLAVNSTSEGPAMDCMGVLYKTTQWPGIWWNLNLQLTYMSTLTSNRLDQADNYLKLIDTYLLSMMKTQDSSKIGDYTWALFIYYKMLRYSGASWKEIERRVLPKAMDLIDIYQMKLNFVDGVYNLEDTESPEFEGFNTYINSNYNLALFKWLLSTSELICHHNQTVLPAREQWKNINSKLHDFLVDENGFMIAHGKPLDRSHRHYSHLLAYYPLQLIDLNNKENLLIFEKSLTHWLSVGGGKELAGYSYTGAASLYALLGDGEKAYHYIRHFLDSDLGMGLLLPNTMYVESGGKNPVIETPLSAATSISELLLQSKEGVIKLFPAVPKDWETCAFMNLRADNGVQVSARRNHFQLEWVSLFSDKETECIIDLKDWKEVYVVKGIPISLKKLSKGMVKIHLPAKVAVCLAANPACEVKWKYPSESEVSYYGIKKGKSLTRQMDWNVEQ